MSEFDTSVFDRIIESGSVDQRISLAQQLADFIQDPDTPATERNAVVPAMVRLASDPVVAVRRTLATACSRAVKLHADIVFTIAADIDEIALNFLMRTPALDAWHMLAILKVGEPNKQAIVVSRGDLGGPAIEYVVEHSDATVVAHLLDNPCAAIEPRLLKKLYVRLTDEQEVTDRLLEREDLPLEIRLMHAKRTSNRVYHLVAQRGWLPANDAEELVVETEESTYVQILETASLEELDKLIPFMCDQGLLTPSIILRAACGGDLELVERALAYLASVPIKRVRSMASGRGLKTLLYKAGMPDSCLMLMRAVVDVAAQARAQQDDLSMEQFGCKVIEFLMTRYSELTAADKSELLDMIARLGAERTRRIASRIQNDLKHAA